MGIFLAERSNRTTSCSSHSNLPHTSALRRKSRAPTFRSNVSSCSVIFSLSWKPPRFHGNHPRLTAVRTARRSSSVLFVSFAVNSSRGFCVQQQHLAATCCDRQEYLQPSSSRFLVIRLFCLLSYLLHRC